MYLSDRDLEFAVKHGLLIVDPEPTEYDTTSIDLHLDKVEEAKVWNIAAFQEQQRRAGHTPLVCPGRFEPKEFSAAFCMPVPDDSAELVYRLGRAVIIKPRGFFLWSHPAMSSKCGHFEPCSKPQEGEGRG
jgi:hypothetical protein